MRKILIEGVLIVIVVVGMLIEGIPSIDPAASGPVAPELGIFIKGPRALDSMNYVRCNRNIHPSPVRIRVLLLDDPCSLGMRPPNIRVWFSAGDEKALLANVRYQSLCGHFGVHALDQAHVGGEFQMRPISGAF